MNKIIKSSKGLIVIFESGSQAHITPRSLYELPTPNPSNRLYLDKFLVDWSIRDYGYFEFDNKNFNSRIDPELKDRLTEEEQIQFESAQRIIDELRIKALNRKPITIEDRLNEKLKKLEEELAKLKEMNKKENN